MEQPSSEQMGVGDDVGWIVGEGDFVDVGGRGV